MNLTIFICVALGLLGLCMGSFAGATVWRLRARQLVYDKKNGESVDGAEYKKLSRLITTSKLKDRSRCLNCGYQLRWFDMIPIVSWLSLGGKCRKCQKSIGSMEFLVEVFTPIFFILSFLFWPTALNNWISITQLVIWLIAGVVLIILFIYDLKWYLLPNKLNYAVVGLGVIYSTLALIGSNDKIGCLISILVSALILSGLYLAIYYFSRRRLIGFGDVILGLGLALLLVDWRLAYIALFAANLIGCIVVLPGIMTGKLKRTSRIPFGPLFILGFWLAGLAGMPIINAIFYSAM